MRNLDQVQAEETRIVTNLSSKSDAGGYLLNESTVLLQTVDFITPLVNNPFVFGMIAAANALSDIYAMGGTPLTVLNILSYPANLLEDNIVDLVLSGGLQKTREAGAVLLGGHTTDNQELIYGLSVTGIVTPNNLIKNSNAKVGDVLILTKPIGATLIAVSATRANLSVDEAALEEAIDCMCLLNKYASELMFKKQVNACTDITGFGLLGHLWEMCAASGVGAVIDTEAVPILTTSLSIIEAGISSSAKSRNRTYLEEAQAVTYNSSSINSYKVELMFEAETSGGLLISTDATHAVDLVKEINAYHKYEYASVIGYISDESLNIKLK